MRYAISGGHKYIATRDDDRRRKAIHAALAARGKPRLVKKDMWGPKPTDSPTSTRTRYMIKKRLGRNSLVVGEAYVDYDRATKRLEIVSVRGLSDDGILTSNFSSGSAKMSRKNLLQLKRLLKKKYPKAREFYGERISGMKAGSGLVTGVRISPKSQAILKQRLLMRQKKR